MAWLDDRSDVSQLLIQPLDDYNMDDGWYLVSSPVIIANWEAASDDRWTVLVGGSVGHIKIGGQPMNAHFQTFYNVARPNFGPDWSLRFQL